MHTYTTICYSIAVHVRNLPKRTHERVLGMASCLYEATLHETQLWEEEKEDEKIKNKSNYHPHLKHLN